MTELREAKTSIRTVTSWPSVTAVRMKCGERWMSVGGIFVPLW